MVFEGKNFVNGQWLDSSCGGTYEHNNPADLTQVTGVWPKSTVEDVGAAIHAGQKAFENWKNLTVYKRAKYLGKALSLMWERIDQIAEVITAENGKTLKESKIEVNAGIKEMEFQINEGLRMSGQVMPCECDGIFAYGIRRPLGVVGVIAPWNFPFNVLCRKTIPALIAGNACVIKPSNLTPGVGTEFVKLFEEASVPGGVINLITGPGSIIGNAMVTNPVIKAISFTGSTDVGMEINRQASVNMTRTQLEMGGKNPIVVLSDADLEQAVDATVLAAYSCAGQWCTSTSRAVIEKSVYEDFVELLLEKIGKIVVGKGTDPNTTMGPVCGLKQMQDICAGIEKGRKEGAKLLTGGSILKTGDLAKGCFVAPTVFADVEPDMFLAQVEIFGPVLSIIQAEDLNKAIETANHVKFGLSSSIYTKDISKAFSFIEKTDVGLTHVNMPTSFKEPQLSFGGVKLSGFGLPEAGHTGIEFFTEHKVVYIKYR